MITCDKCGRGPRDGIAVYRQNELGVLGVFRCEPCGGLETMVDPEVVEITKIIEGTNENT